MNIIHTRRIAQVFFFVLFTWFCVVSTVGEGWNQLRGWPINWFLQLDPLVGLGTWLTTRKVYAGLAWGVATVILTIVLGRFFCGWVCPLGTLQQLVGWLSRKQASRSRRLLVNQYHPAQRTKYYILIALLCGAGVGLLQTGLLDPIPLMQRSVNLVILAVLDGVRAGSRIYVGVWSLAVVFLALVLSSIWVPRFFCRFICPLGALFGLLVRWTPWRVGKRNAQCSDCGLCESDCEGACEPFGQIRVSECVLCLNCLKACRQGETTYSPARSAAGEVVSPELSRRGFLASVATGVATAPSLRLGGGLDRNWSPGLIRPPGALTEQSFLERCIKCGQCMRICPTNTLQPALAQAGWQGLWTPVLNFRAGTSGCQLNCIACGNVCPTTAIRPISLDEKLGRGRFAEAGPIRLGTAFVDRGRCLPWAMDIPCIVCQETCPVSPKAITLREEFQIIHDGARTVKSATPTSLTLDAAPWADGSLGTGNHFIRLEIASSPERRLLAENSGTSLSLAAGAALAEPPASGSRIFVEVALQKPVVDTARCIGCGICEHECPVSGLRAIRITAENESRNSGHSLTAKA